MNRQSWASRLVSVVAAGVAITAAASISADEVDYHGMFEERCAVCHGHAGAFARENLQVRDGMVLGSAGQDLRPLLSVHKGGLPAEQIRGMLEMFRAQIESGAFFYENCTICHGRAYDFARLLLIERDGVLWGRYSVRPIAEFLPGHARMTADQARRMTAALTAILAGGR